MSVKTLSDLAAAAQRAREAGHLCVPLSIDECEAIVVEAAALNLGGYMVAMALMQSGDTTIDDATRAAIDAFVTPENARAAIMGGQPTRIPPQPEDTGDVT